jgi:hypothetical protein
MDSDLQDRVAELEARSERLILAGDARDVGGWGAWSNHLETRLLQERNFLTDVVAHALAEFQRQIIDTCKVLIAEAMAQRVRGTFDAKASYVSNDVVACDGASFIARRDNPGPCPGSGWQMIARQGARGIAGPKGERGRDAPKIDKWIVDRGNYTVTPVYSDGIFGPALNLAELFAQSETT